MEMLERRRMMGRIGNKGHNLPPKYQEVEYLTSTGSQYIITNIIPNQRTIIETYAETSFFDGNTRNIFGVRNGSNFFRVLFFSYVKKISSRYGSPYTEYTPITQKEGKHYFRLGDGIFAIDKENISIKTTPLTIGIPLFLFAINNNRSPYEYFVGDLYAVNHIEDGENKNVFVPCYRKADHKPGMYDVVYGVFYTNSGTGEFIVGTNVR